MSVNVSWAIFHVLDIWLVDRCGASKSDWLNSPRLKTPLDGFATVANLWSDDVQTFIDVGKRFHKNRCFFYPVANRQTNKQTIFFHMTLLTVEGISYLDFSLSFQLVLFDAEVAIVPDDRLRTNYQHINNNSYTKVDHIGEWQFSLIQTVIQHRRSFLHMNPFLEIQRIVIRGEINWKYSHLLQCILQNWIDNHWKNHTMRKSWCQIELSFEDCIAWITMRSYRWLQSMKRSQCTNLPLYSNKVSSTAIFLDGIYFDKHISFTWSRKGRIRCNRSLTTKFSQSANRRKLLERKIESDYDQEKCLPKNERETIARQIIWRMKYWCYKIRIGWPIFMNWSFLNHSHMNYYSKKLFHFVARHLQI